MDAYYQKAVYYPTSHFCSATRLVVSLFGGVPSHRYAEQRSCSGDAVGPGVFDCWRMMGRALRLFPML
jgi:hypothetical protein